MLDARIPYSVAALDEYVGSRADQHVSAEEARLLANRSYWRALKLLAVGKPAGIGMHPAIGLGCTATIATDREKRGDHRCHIAVRTAAQTATFSLTLRKGARDRNGEEEVVSRLAINALAEACGVGERAPVKLKEGEAVVEARERTTDPLARIAAGDLSAVTFSVDGDQQEGVPACPVVLSGSFNPLHDGHLRLAETARAITGKPVVFELSISNVEKPDLTPDQLHARLAQFLGRHTVVVTRARTFVEKAKVLPGATFVVGYDTAARLFDDRFYPAFDPAADPENTGSPVGAALGQIMRAGSRFLVAGRAVDGTFKTLKDIAVPPLYRGLLEAIPESRFRADVSSTQLRSKSQ